MPEDTKKNQQKGKNEPKDQRKRRGRQHAAAVEKKVEKEPELPEVTAPEKPVFEPPPPEFYQNLKRETDEILKITEEANTKYKKKEIQSNWAKYEMPIESYEEIDEQENLGADYETLIQAPLTVGGHFQFKHEKSWDISTGPSPYDKYFDINMDNLSIALSTIPFYERNSIDTSFFNESDIQTMIHRASKYKHKYYKDKKFVTPEIEAEAKILNILKSDDNVDSIETIETDEKANDDKNNQMLNQFQDIKLEDCEEPDSNKASEENQKPERNAIIEPSLVDTVKSENESSQPVDHSNLTEDKVDKETGNLKISNTAKNIDGDNKIDNDFNEFLQNDDLNKKSKVVGKPRVEKKHLEEVMKPVDLIPKQMESPKAPNPMKNPVIESPEDLEKWLDDFLDS
ncbi:uncharacterized protein LOC120631694 isoform X1 [Pararge aegeria]|uniref:uncharacterized protein LOC120631694 isoform X1 n=1 Tax=Pararge aegeria TaxID=116150 RepID=UPI0019D22D25|nr:uncharacterized protein LOC120631694 isoform X1 [Pararge aegeria]